MKKFFTLCLAFMLASLLNMSAADTYTLVGENINGVSWDPAATQNDLVYEASTDSYVITGVTMSGKFKVAKNHAWTTAWGNNGKSIPTGAAYIAWTTGGDIAMPDNQTYTNCTVRFKLLDGEAASILITSDTAMSGTIDTQVTDWCIAGVFADGDHWDDTHVMTNLGGGVYEWWCETLPTEFKFKGKGGWDYNFGIPTKDNKDRYTAILGYENAVDNGGNNIKMTGNAAYNKYRIRLTVRGYVASFRVDGYKEAVPSLTRVFYESFDKNAGTGGNNDDKWSDSDANTEVSTDNFDKTGWSVTKGYAGNKCIKLGTSSVMGIATTPALGVTGNAELRFKAGAWNGDATTINITINNGGTLSASSVTIANNAFTDYTISISDATPESTITFSATKASKNRFFLDEVEVYANSSELPAAGISLNGVMKDANTAYYHSTLQTPTVTVTLPAGATHMDIEVDNNGWIDEYLSAKGKTEDYTIEFYSTGNFTINVTAYGEGVYSVASKDIAIETVSSVYTFDELINKGEGATCYLNFSPTVVAHVGKYLYLEGYDMWEGIRSSALVYASLDKTYNKGDVLQGFIATVSYYNGNPQLTPLTTSLGDVFGMSEPYVYEVEAGDAWKAFAVEANVNKYVRVKNAPVTANPDAVDGVTAYTKHLGVNMPEDVTKKYDVEGFINNFNGTIQIKPISFTAIEEKIEPFTYTEIVPANNAEVTSLSEIKITFPYEVAYDATVAMGVLVMDGANMVTPTVTVEGAVATLTFDAITAYGSKPSLNVMAGAFKETASNVGCQQFMASWTIPTPPITYDLAPVKVTPASGSTVEKLEKITLQVSEDVYDCRWAAQSYGNDFITVTDDKGNSYNGKLGYTSYTEYYYLYVENATAPGTYTITVKEGVFGDEQYLKKFEKGHANPEFTLTYTIKGAALAAPTVSPANGAEVENLNTITLTFAEAVTVNAEAGNISIVNTSDAGSDFAKDINVVISEDGLTATITCVPGYLDRWAPGKTYKLNIPAGYFVATSGATSEAIEYSWIIAAPKFTYVNVDPAQGEVTELSEILISFAQKTYGYGSNPTLNLVDADGNVVTTASTVRSTDANGNWFAIKATLKDKVTTPGTYTLVVPENSFTDVDFGDSGNKSAAFDLTWTVMEPSPYTYTYGISAIDPAEGEITSLGNQIFVTASGDWFEYSNEAYSSKNWIKITDEKGNSYNTGVGYVTDTQAVIYIMNEEHSAPRIITEPGTYTMTIPKGTFGDRTFYESNQKKGNLNPELVYTWTIKAAEVVEDFTPVISPAAGEITVDQMDVTVITFDTPIASFNDSNVRYIKAAGGNVWFFGTSKISEDRLTLTLNWELVKGNYPVGTSYTLELPAGCIVLENGAKNLLTTVDYTLVAPDNTVYDYAPVTVSPANGSEVESLEKIYVSFPYGVYDCLWAALEYSTDFIKVSDENGNTYEAKIGYGSYTEDYYIYVKDATAPGKYTIVVPKGLVFDEEHSETYASGHANPEFTLTYTLVAPVVEDFTPVINPTAGNVTVEQIKTTVLSFESPIASFDDSDVRYAKPLYGSVWCSVAGSYTISEDKLSLTINWDFSPEVGLTYTLELPAGCIVLENGAKNLFTQVAYTVVAGPKDLAEFVVPAGINGYINYDETDVNAWAPEFPFTVSTTAYNTVAFAAELPSLPAGITAMEVIDENGEVIAVLNQDGVAPLADGEIYYVKGETTKEYVDGAELKFRFRFTHLGVSETIQFSYIIAGGNITSIADVELDGNVIVRGNDIIAPQGAAIFTVSGIRVPAEGLAPGVYVVVLGNQAVKVMVK